MSQALIKLLNRANIYMDENDGNGNDLPGGKTPEQLAADKEAADKAAADQADADKKAAADKEAADKAAADADNKGKGGQPTEAEAKLLKEVMTRKAREKDLEAQLNALKGALGDTTADDVAKILAERKDQERKELEKRGEYDRILEQVKTEHAKELDALKADLESTKLLVSQKDDTLVEMTVGRAFSESPFIREKSLLPAGIARKEFGTHVDLVDGVAVVYDKPRGAAERTPLVGADGKAKSFEDGIQALYAAHPDGAGLLRAQGKPGAGSGSQDLGGHKPNEQKPKHDGLAGVDRIAAALNKKNQ